MTQDRTAILLGISQPEVSRMFKGHFREYSIERLIGFLTAFGFDVEIIAKPRRDGKSETRGRIAFSTRNSKPLTG